MSRQKKNNNNHLVDEKRLSLLYPKLCEEWDGVRNFPLLPNEVSFSSHKKVWWICRKKDCGHTWLATINKRTSKKPSGCPACSGNVVSDKNRLSIKFPQIVFEWDYEKNFPLVPSQVSFGSHRRVWWKCLKHDCGCGWSAKINNRTSGDGCPICGGQIVTDKNRLSVVFPNISDEWDYEKNYPLTPKDVGYGSGRKFWWKCMNVCCGHVWRATPNNRCFDNNGCPLCSKGPISKVSQLWLDSLRIPNVFGKTREVCIMCGEQKYRVDGFDPETNTIYEFLGDFWHGNPSIFVATERNAICKKTFGELYNDTMGRFRQFENHGYRIIYIWELDYLKD
jgi:hypothetical protein